VNTERAGVGVAHVLDPASPQSSLEARSAVPAHSLASFLPTAVEPVKGSLLTVVYAAVSAAIDARSESIADRS
jgi:hypothetical protein